jgi:hypothetical protein
MTGASKKAAIVASWLRTLSALASHTGTRRFSCMALLIAVSVLASSEALAQTFSVRPVWQNTGIYLQPGETFVAQVAGTIDCTLCRQYYVVAWVGSTQYDLRQTTVKVTEGGQLWLRIWAPDDLAASWQGSYQVRITHYAAAPLPFTARLGSDCGRLKTEGIVAGSHNPALPGGNSMPCHIYMEDWVINSADRVFVCLPGAIDGWGGHSNGIVVFGAGSVPTSAMSGYSSNWQEAQPIHTGHSVYPWTISFSARPNATSGTITVDTFQGRSCTERTGNGIRFQIEVTVSSPSIQVSLASVYATGWGIARAVYGGSANLPGATTLEALRYTNQQAAATGLLDTTNTTAFVIGQLTRGATSAQVASNITEVFNRFNTALNRACTYGTVSTNLGSAYNVGYNLSLAEIAALNNLPLAAFRTYLTGLRQWAEASQIFPTPEIDRGIGYLGTATQSMQFKDYMVSLRNQFNTVSQKMYTCRR